MKKFLVIALLILVASAPALSQKKSASPNQPSSSEEQAVLQTLREIAAAFTRGDTQTLDRLLADELTDVAANGSIWDKRHNLTDLRPDDTTSFSFEELKVRIYGNTAVVTGVEIANFKEEGKETTACHRFTNAFVKQQGRWRLVATHISRLKAN